jgi:hypothetical protein
MRKIVLLVLMALTFLTLCIVVYANADDGINCQLHCWNGVCTGSFDDCLNERPIK